jgi:hypothetical protein
MIKKADRVARKPRTTEDWIERYSCCRTSSVTSVNLIDMPKPGTPAVLSFVFAP